MTWALITTVVIAAIGAIVYVGLPKVSHRIVVVCLFVVLAGVLYGSSIDSLGQPKPIALEWRDLTDREIVALQFGENGEVYAMINRDDGPALYEFPPMKNSEAQQKLEDAYGSKERTGAQFYVAKEGDEVADVELPENPPPKNSQDNVMTVP